MDTLVIIIIVAAILLVVIVAVVIIVMRFRKESNLVAMAASALPALQQIKQHERMTPSTESLPSSKKLQGILFFEFDVFCLDFPFNNPVLMKESYIQNYIDRVKEMWKTLTTTNGLEIQIISNKNTEDAIQAILRTVNMTPPAKIVGADSLQRLGLSKPQYVKQEWQQRKVDMTFYVDNSAADRTEVFKFQIGTILCCNSKMKNLLSGMEMDSIIASVVPYFFNGSERWVVSLRKYDKAYDQTIKIASYGKLQYFDNRNKMFMNDNLKDNELKTLTDLISKFQYVQPETPCNDCTIYELEIEQSGEKTNVTISSQQLPKLIVFLNEFYTKVTHA